MVDNGAATFGFIDTVGAGSALITIARNDVASWAPSTNNIYVYGQITFEIQ